MELFWLFSIAFTLLFANPICATDDTKLIFVQILFRHGDRAPINLYPNDPNQEDVWPEGLGKLTMLGRKQHFALGKYFRNMYKNFTTSSPLEVEVISSDCDRCLRSAESNLASFFQPSDKWAFDEHFLWQPIPIRYIPEDVDKYLEVDSICPRADAEQQNVIHSPAGEKIMAEHQEMFDNLTFYSGKPLPNWIQASYLYDTLFVEKKYNLTIPPWVHPWYDELQLVSNMSFFWSYDSPLLHRLRSGPLIQRIIETMTAKLQGDTPNLKFQIYSAHDTTIALVLDALNLFDKMQPAYASALLFELYEDTAGKQLLRLLYQNSPYPEAQILTPRPLILEGCTEFCPLEYFVNYTRNLIPDDWDAECQLDKSIVEKIQDKKVTIGWFFILIAGVIVCLSVYALWRIYSRKQEKDNIYILKGLRLEPN